MNSIDHTGCILWWIKQINHNEYYFVWSENCMEKSNILIVTLNNVRCPIKCSSGSLRGSDTNSINNVERSLGTNWLIIHFFRWNKWGFYILCFIFLSKRTQYNHLQLIFLIDRDSVFMPLYCEISCKIFLIFVPDIERKLIENRSIYSFITRMLQLTCKDDYF